MKNIEFFNGNDGVVYAITENDVKILDVSECEIVDEFFDLIRENYEDAWNKLCDEYITARRNVPYFKFCVVRRFIKCNMGECDRLEWDVDNGGRFHLEMVKCPLRGECNLENVVCRPKPSTGLSGRESEVLALLSEGMSNQEVADELFISVHTVRVHVAHILSKLKMKTIKQASAWYLSLGPK